MLKMFGNSFTQILEDNKDLTGAEILALIRESEDNHQKVLDDEYEKAQVKAAKLLDGKFWRISTKNRPTYWVHIESVRVERTREIYLRGWFTRFYTANDWNNSGAEKEREIKIRKYTKHERLSEMTSVCEESEFKQLSEIEYLNFHEELKEVINRAINL